MELNLEDGVHVVKSLTRKALSALASLSTSDKNFETTRSQKSIKAFTDDITAEDDESFAGVFDSLPYSLDREEEICEIKLDSLFSKSGKANESDGKKKKIIPKQDTACCKEITEHSHALFNDSSTCKRLRSILNNSNDSKISHESLNLSSSFSIYLLDKSRAKLLDTCLGLSESLRKVYLNGSSNSQPSLTSSYPRPLTEGPCEESSFLRDVSYGRPEIFRVHPDTDRNVSLNSSNFSSFSGDSNQKSVKIGYDTSSSSLHDASCTSDFNESESPYLSFIKEKSSINQPNETESPYSTRLSPTGDEFSTSSLNETDSGNSMSSLTEEFKHDIDYLAKSTFRTSTPDSLTRESSETSLTRTEASSGADSNESSKTSRNTFMTMSDSLVSLSSKDFVHGLSPLCNVPPTVRSGISSSRVRVRRSLVFVSPYKNIVTVRKLECGESPNCSDYSPPVCTRSNITSELVAIPNAIYKRDSVLPKIMFQDETEEAVYYLITKYLDNSQCLW